LFQEVAMLDFTANDLKATAEKVLGLLPDPIEGILRQVLP
jgi:hypothetical protein